MCPKHYQNLARRVWLEAPNYRPVQGSEYEAQVQKFYAEFTKIKISRLKRPALTEHQFGLATTWPKHSNLQKKGRPILSYANHFAREALSALGRGGMYVLQRCLQDKHHMVFSLQNVVDRVQGHNITAQFNEYKHCCVMKTDIDNFFPNIPFTTIRESLDWFTKLARETLRCEYVHVPTLFEKRNVQNGVFLKYMNWTQVRSYKKTLRRIVKDRPTAELAASSNCKQSYYGIAISDIQLGILLDVTNAFARFGAQLLLQIQGIPQGSSSSVFLASLAAAYLEYHRFPTFLLSPILVNCFVTPLRWIDDILLIVSSTEAWTKDDQHELIERLRTIVYPEFGLKIEDPSVFVGIALIPTQGGVDGHMPSMDTLTPHLPHGHSNIGVKHIKGYLKGALMRLIDSATDPQYIPTDVKCMFAHISYLCIPPKLLRSAIFDLMRKFLFLRELQPAIPLEP